MYLHGTSSPFPHLFCLFPVISHFIGVGVTTSKAEQPLQHMEMEDEDKGRNTKHI